jgi:DNA polymerase I-like protein with 3'-5' exonuclease and polymerase domains
MSRSEASNYKRIFLETYPGLVEWFEAVGDAQQEFKRISTRTLKNPIFRAQLLSPFNHYRFIQHDVRMFTKLTNLAVQGSAVIGMKQAMLDLSKTEWMPYFVMVVHDEVVLTDIETYERAQQAASEVEQIMTNAMVATCPGIPIEVESTISHFWKEKYIPEEKECLEEKAV